MTSEFEAAARRDFPAVQSNQTILLDNAGGTAPCRQAIEALTSYLADCPQQLGATYAPAIDAAERLEACAQSACRMLDARANVQPHQIVFGASTTALINALAMGLRSKFAPGDEIIVTNFDHESNIGAWRALQAQGLQIREWVLSSDQRVELADLECLLTDRTRLVAFSHSSNILGQITDIKAACQLIRSAGAISVVDGVAYAPHRPLRVTDWDVDFYVFSYYKVFGPHVACLYASDRVVDLPDNLNHFFHAQAVLGTRLVPGACPYELIAGTQGVSQYFADLENRLAAHDSVWSAIEAHEISLAQPILDFLKSEGGIELVGTTDASSRLPVISFRWRNRPPSDAPAFFDAKGIGLRYGHFYAPRLVRALDCDPAEGVVRISLAHYNTRAEVDYVVEQLDAYTRM